MKTNIEELRSKSAEELDLMGRNTAEEIWKMRFQQHTGQLTNTSSLVASRKRLARIKTIQNERRQGIAAPGEG